MNARRSPSPRLAVRWSLALALLLGVAGSSPAAAQVPSFDPSPRSAFAAAALPTDPSVQLAPPSAPSPAGPAIDPSWSDPLDGKADSGVGSVSGPRESGKPAVSGVEWVAGASGQAAALASDTSYIGYAGARLKTDRGTILFRYKPIPDLAGAYAKRHDGWTDYGQHKPPQSGFLIDTIGWNAAPKGSFTATLNPAAKGGITWGVWDGSKWHYTVWTTPDGFVWDANRWYEIGLNWGPKGMSILVDGERKAAIPDVVQINNTIPWFLGQGPWYWPYGPHSLLGAYDDLRVYGEQVEPYVQAVGGTPAPASGSAPAPGGSTSAPAGSTPASGVSAGATPAPSGGATGAATKASPSAQAQQKPATQPAPGAQTKPAATGTPGVRVAGDGGLIASLAAKLPGGDSGSVASAARQIDALNLAGSLPGGVEGPAAAAVDKLPGGTPLLCGWPILLGAALVVLLVGFLAGRTGRRRSEPAAVDRSTWAEDEPDLVPTAPPSFSPPPPAAAGPASAASVALAEPAAARFCDNCGKPLGDNTRFCESCGAPIE